MAPARTVLVAAIGCVACAQELPPPGALPDEIPPSIQRIEPAPDSVVPGFDGSLRIRYDEPVNIPNDLVRRMFVSPMEPYLMETGFSDMRLEPERGWRENVVYCFSIPEGVSDLLRNRVEEPTEFCFSTGAEIANTRVAGSVTDGITGLPQNEARVAFVPADSMAALDDTIEGDRRFHYGALADQEGRFRARALPPGTYRAFGFIDQNRNLDFDRRLEPYDSATFVAGEDSLTQLDFVTIPPDSTGPVLLRAQATDRVTIQLEYDDYLINPATERPTVSVRDSARGIEIEVLEAHVGQPSQVRFATDTVAAQVRPDSVGGPEPGAERGDPAVDPSLSDPEDPAAAGPSDPPLPSRFIAVRVATPLDSITYIVSTSGVVNVRTLTGGGDTSFVAEPPAPAVADTTGVVADSGAVEGAAPPAVDTTEAVDTIRVTSHPRRGRRGRGR
ncbi:MAG: hypothetical protein MJB57_04170 [Gemmatimonadetes bacterium]|nr:hypothetical protein [Gemmatimonadota bacterium]